MIRKTIARKIASVNIAVTDTLIPLQIKGTCKLFAHIFDGTVDQNMVDAAIVATKEMNQGIGKLWEQWLAGECSFTEYCAKSEPFQRHYLEAVHGAFQASLRP